jgi:hypothetical protein
MKNPVNENFEETTLSCSCKCGSLDVEYWKDEDGIILSYNIPAFYAFQETFWNRFKTNAGLIWSILVGKRYRLYELALDTKSEVEKFKAFVAEIDTSKLPYED